MQFQLGTVIRIFESEVIVGKFTSNTYFSFPVKVINLIKETLEGKIILHEELGPYYRYLVQKNVIRLNNKAITKVYVQN